MLSSRYDRVAVGLHWLIALAIIGMLAFGWLLDDVPKEMKFQLYQLHKSIGITILVLSVFRLAWRATHPAPPLPSATKPWEALLAKGTHVALYILMIGIPLAGWAMVSASPRNLPTVLYGVIPWPHLPVLPTLENKKEVSELAGKLHGVFASSLAVLLVLHLGAAVKHHFVVKDDILLRIAPTWAEGLLEKLRGKK